MTYHDTNRKTQLKKYFLFFSLLAAIFFYICIEIALHSVSRVNQLNLLPYWDPALHSLNGWELCFYLKSLNLPMFLWEIWNKGIWPCMFYLYQLPFYIIVKHQFEGALISSLFAFGCIGVLSAFFFVKLLKELPLISISVFIFLLISSPMYVAFSSLAMTETFGCLMQLFVFTCYLLTIDPESHNPRLYILFAVSLTILFFTKYNYFILAVIPIIINEYLTKTNGTTFKYRLRNLLLILKKLLSGWTGKVLFVYIIFLMALIFTGGFEFHIFNQKVLVHSIGNTGYIILYFLLFRLWLAHRRRKIDWQKIFQKDPRIHALLYYFVIPLTFWFAVPYPNHIKEFFSFIINRNSEGITLLSGIRFYFDIFRMDYFQNDLIFFSASLVFLIALLRYKFQTRVIKWLLIAAVIQIVLVVFHSYKGERFIYTALLPFWLVIAAELNNWSKKINMKKFIIYPLSVIIVFIGIITFNNVLKRKVFNKYAFNLYTNNPALNNSFEWVRKQLHRNDGLIVIGSISNIISPALVEWELGNPSGFRNYIGPISTNEYKKLKIATHLLVIEPMTTNIDVEMHKSFDLHSEKIRNLITEKKISYLSENKIDNPGLIFKIYKINKE